MQNHYIVCGLGHIGYRIVQLLRRLGESVAVVTQATREDWLRDTKDAGIRVVVGDARDETVLAELGIARASALLCVTNRDAINIEIALDAKRNYPNLPIVIRLFDVDLAAQLERSFQIRRALAVSSLAAPSFAAAALGESVIGSFAHKDSFLVVGQVKVMDGSQLQGLSRTAMAQRHDIALIEAVGGRAGKGAEERLESGEQVTLVAQKEAWDQLVVQDPAAQKRRSKHLGLWARFVRSWKEAGAFWRSAPLALRIVFLLIIMMIVLSVVIFRSALRLSLIDAFYFMITTVTTTGYGDISLRDASTWIKLYGCGVMLLCSLAMAILYSFITTYVIAEREKAQRIPEGDHVILVGLGNVGYRILGELQMAKIPTVVIEADPSNDLTPGVRQSASVLTGDGRIRELLDEANVRTARAVIAATGDDVKNVSVGLSARQANPKARVILRIFDADFARKLQAGLRFDAALGAFAVAAPTFVAAALYEHVRVAILVDQVLLTLCERKIDPAWVGLSPLELFEKHGIQVLMRQSTGQDRFTLSQGTAPLRVDEEILVLLRRPLLD